MKTKIEVNKKEGALLLIGLLLISFASSMVYFSVAGFSPFALQAPGINQAVKDDLSRINVYLNIKAFDSNGNLKAEYSKNDDLMTNNFFITLAGILTNNKDNVLHVVKDITNTDRNLYTRHSSTIVTTGLFYYMSGVGGYIGIGTGTTDPTISDYKLQTEVESRAYLTSSSYSNGNITVSSSITSTGSRTITEAGYFQRWGNSASYIMLWFRDTFGGISVVSGDTVTVTYVIQLGDTGFTNNFGLLLQGLMDHPTGNQYITLTDTSGSSFNVYGYVQSSAYSVLNSYGGGGVMVGEGNTAPAITDYTLESPVLSWFQNSDPAIISNSVTFASAFVDPSSSHTLTESGFGWTMWQSNGAPAHPVLFWRVVFDPVYVSAGAPFAVAYTVTGT